MFTENLKKIAKSLYTKQDLKDHQSIAALIINNKRQILVLDHVKHGAYTIPIGKVDPGETPRESLLKELQEELGITATRFSKINMHTENYKMDGVDTKVKNHVYLIEKFAGEPENKEPDKHRKMEWMSFRDLKKLTNVTEATRRAINWLTNRNRG